MTLTALDWLSDAQLREQTQAAFEAAHGRVTT